MLPQAGHRHCEPGKPSLKVGWGAWGPQRTAPTRAALSLPPGWSREASQGPSSGRASAEAAAACLGSHAVGPVLSHALSSRRSLPEPAELSRPLSAPAPASAGQQPSVWREMGRHLAAAASEHKMSLFRAFIVLSVVSLGEF